MSSFLAAFFVSGRFYFLAKLFQGNLELAN